MKIDKIEIAGFGKLNNFTLDFDDGLNLILGENESGKSTICDFLLCMFYDMPNDGKRTTLSENLRRKYKPWKGESYGGRIFFTDDGGKKYIVEKSFGATKRSDRSKVLDADSWTECDSGENIGERLFGLSREGFLKTLYIKSLNVGSMSGGGEEVLAKLSNMETSGDEDVSYSNIKNALEKEMFSILSKTGRGGKIPSLQEEEKLLSLELSRAEMVSASLKNDENRMIRLKDEINETEKEIGKFEKLSETAIRHENFLAQNKSLETAEFINKRLVDEEKRLSELLNNEFIPLSDENIDVLKAELVEKQTEKSNIKLKTNIIIPLSFSIIVFLLIFLIGILIKKTVLFTAFGILASLIVAVFAYILQKNKKSKFEKLGLEIADIERKIESFNKQNYNDHQIKQTEKMIEELKTGLLSFETKTEEFSQDEIEYDGDSSSEIAAKIRTHKEKLKSLNEEFLKLSVSVAAQSGGERTKDEIKSEIVTVNEQIEKLQIEYNAYKKCAEWMEKAYEEIKQNYAPLLNKKTEEIFKALTKDKYKGVRLSENLDINYKNEYDEIVESGHLSQGAYDLLYISLKFSAMSILCEKIPPVILDDAFIQLDDGRLKLMVEFIKNSEKFSQVILFTCHKKTTEVFEDVKIIELI